MRTIFNKIAAAAIVVTAFLSSCQPDNLGLDIDSSNNGYTTIVFKANIPDMQQVVVRAVDPDGIDIQNIDLFCFNELGLYITTVSADITSIDKVNHTGTFKATIPEDTHIIHFLANQNSNIYNPKDFLGQPEEQVLANMEGASGMLIYWARFEYNPELQSIYPGDVNLSAQLHRIGEIEMIRNQAQVSIAEWSSEKNNYFDVSGFVTTNIHAFGTVAPLHPSDGFVWKAKDNQPFITLPGNKTMMSDITDINTKAEDYIFEHENSINNPVSVIIKGRHPGESQDLYYRIAIIDENSDPIMIQRNHAYILHIGGKLTNGSATFAEALEAPFTNNIWFSIENWVTEVEDNNYRLSVEKTGIVLDDTLANKQYTIRYKLESKSGSLTATDKPEISWLDGNNVAKQTFDSHIFDTRTGEGSITITLNPLNDKPIHQGSLLIKKGRLHRTIDIALVSKQSFTPSWIDTHIYGNKTGEYVTFKFTVPEDCPDIIYPFNAYISVNSLDVRYGSGMALPVINKSSEEWYGEELLGTEYKYQYTIEGPGVHRIYFKNILKHEDNATDSLFIEAPHFSTLKKTFKYHSDNYVINVSGLESLDGKNSNGLIAKDETIYYYLVPAKKNANISFDMLLVDSTDISGRHMNAKLNDEFLFYSKSLDFVNSSSDVTFTDIDESYWSQSTNGRVVAFKPNAGTESRNDNRTGHYQLNFTTNRAYSDDVVRITSNQQGQLSAFNEGISYSGETYSSIIFEFATYRPFRFAARVETAGKVLGENAIGQTEEKVSNIVIPYEPTDPVDLTFEITSFRGSNNKEVDPFGSEFEIYIDAPMLQIDEARRPSSLPEEKFFAHPTIEGRFVYVVDKDRETERSFGNDNVILKENGYDHSGERKSLPFKKRRATTAGEITFSADESMILFYEKKFKISNEPITGNIHYNLNNVETPVEKNSFVAFARTSDGVRIGSLTIAEDGKYSLNLRSEYNFNWNTEEVEFDYIAPDNKVYAASVSSLAELYSSRDIVLTEVTQ